MWTLVVKKDEKRKKDLHDHAFLILSKEDSALVLKTEEEITEMDESGFNTSSKTIFAGNMGNDRFIVQVNFYSFIFVINYCTLFYYGEFVYLPIKLSTDYKLELKLIMVNCIC